MTDNVISVDGRNVGDGLGVFANNTGGTSEILTFKSLIGGPGIILNDDDTTITVEYVGLGSGGAVSFLKLIETPSTIEPFGILYGTQHGTINFITPPIAANTCLVYNGSSFVWQALPILPEQFSIKGTNGISVSDDTSFVVGLSPSGVTAGSYTCPDMTIDTYGRVVAAVSQSNNSISSLSSKGGGASLLIGKTASDFELRSVRAAGSISITTTDTEIVIGSTPVSISMITDENLLVASKDNSFSLSLAPTSVVPGTYSIPTIVVDEFGRIGAITSTEPLVNPTVRNIGSGLPVFAKQDGSEFQFRSLGTSGAIAISQTDTDLTFSVDAGVTRIAIEASDGILVEGQAVTSTGTFTIALDTSGVVPGTYTNPTLNVDSMGRITEITSSEASVVAVVSGQGTVVSTGPSFKVDLTPTGVAPGTYDFATIVVDEEGRITSAIDNSVFTKGLSITLQGDIVGTGVVGQPIDVFLSKTGVVAGSYSNADLTVDEQGRIVAITAVDPPAPQPVTLPPTGVAQGRYDNASIIVDAQGRITSATSSTASLVPTDGKPGQVLTYTDTPTWAFPIKKHIPADQPAVDSWRLAITKIDSDKQALLAISDISFRETHGGEKIALHGTVICDDAGWGPNVPAFAFDANPTSTFIATSLFDPSGVAYIGFQFDHPMVVRDFSITASSQTGCCAPAEFSVQYLLAGTWTTAWAVSSTAWTAGETRSFPNGHAIDEAFRMLVDTPHSYIGQGLSHLRVNVDETAIEFVKPDRTSGPSGNRPNYGGEHVGAFYFDTSITKPIWWTGTTWVDAMGTVA